MECPHLKPLKDELDLRGIPITYDGQPWSDNCRRWIYYDCLIDPEAVINRLKLDPCIEVHINSDEKSGLEQGLKCSICHDAIIGVHLKNAHEKIRIH